MPSGKSDWERSLAADRREAERQAKERAKQEKEREKARKEAHFKAQQRKAEKKTAAVERQIEELDNVLTDALNVSPFSFEQLMEPAVPTKFDAGRLAAEIVGPDWSDYVPEEPKGLGRLFGGSSRYARTLSEARARFDAAVRYHEEQEKVRQRALADAEKAHKEQLAADRKRIAEVKERQAAFIAGEPEAVEWFVGQALNASRYPKDFPRARQVAYRPENRDVVVELELPPQKVVPDVRSFRFVKARDAIDPVARPITEIRQRYKRLIACIALRTLHEIFAATPGEVVDGVVFNGRLSTIDRATGKPARPHLLSVSTSRKVFADLVLASVEPSACLTRLNALVSPNPYDLEPVEPFIEFDLKRFRFTDDLDVVAGLDSRQNLLKLSPTEFEHLIRQLFEAMGSEAWTTIPSKDGGVDAVVTSKHLVFGSVCLIQAKRWKDVVGLDAVHALTGVMADHNATNGVLVTTSWFGRSSEEFANRNRITLINGAELKHLIKEKLGRDVIPGTNPPKRLRASDNKKTGRPGPSQAPS